MHTEYCFDYVRIVPLLTTDNTAISGLTSVPSNLYNTRIGGQIGVRTKPNAIHIGSIFTFPNLSSFKLLFHTDGSEDGYRGYRFKIYESTVKFDFKSSL